MILDGDFISLSSSVVQHSQPVFVFVLLVCVAIASINIVKKKEGKLEQVWKKTYAVSCATKVVSPSMGCRCLASTFNLVRAVMMGWGACCRVLTSRLMGGAHGFRVLSFSGAPIVSR